MHAGYAKADNLCNRTPVCGRAKVLPVELENGNVVGLAEACGTLGHHLQHGLQLGRRGADDSQNLGCRRLLLERPGSTATLKTMGIVVVAAFAANAEAPPAAAITAT